MVDTQILDTLQQPHLSGHRCPDERGVLGWFNPNAGDRDRCPVLVGVAALRTRIAELHDELTVERQRVHAAAHDPAAVEHVAAGMVSTPLTDLHPDLREGWTYMAREGIEALAAWLDPEVVTGDARPS